MEKGREEQLDWNLIFYLYLSVPMTSVVAWIASLDDLKNCQVVSGIMRIQLMDSFFDCLNVNFFNFISYYYNEFFYLLHRVEH